MPDNAFVKDGSPYTVPCAWQIWERRPFCRPDWATPDVSHLIRYVADPGQGEFAMRRVGFYAGQVKEPPEWRLADLSPSTHYFLQSVRADARQLLRSIDWSDVCRATAGSLSLSKHEVAVKLAGASCEENSHRLDAVKS